MKGKVMQGVNLPKHVAENVQYFTGRPWVLESITNWLDNPDSPLLLITGKPGTGKSMIAAWLAGCCDPFLLPQDEAHLKRIRDALTGAHFCQALTPYNSPREMADRLARQAVENLTGFDKYLLNVGGQKRIEISVGKVTGRSSVTVLSVKKLDLGGLIGEEPFNLALSNPLKQMQEAGNAVPALFLIDSLDEAAQLEGFNIVQAVQNLTSLKGFVRVIATTRDEPDLLARFPLAERVDLVDNALWVEQASGVEETAEDGEEPAQVTRIFTDVQIYVTGRLAGQSGWANKDELINDLLCKAGSNFLFAHLVVEDLLKKTAKGETPTLDDIPDGLGRYYQRSLELLIGGNQAVWNNEIRPLMGTIAVAQGSGLEWPQLAKVIDRDLQSTQDRLRECKPYLTGALKNGPFRLFHQSFQDFLVDDDENEKYLVLASEAHGRISDSYWPKTAEKPNRRDWDRYGRDYLPVHLAGAAQTPDGDECHRNASRLVNLVVAPVLAAPEDKIKAGARELRLALLAACADLKVEALPLVIKSVKAYLRFHQHRLKPEEVLAAAEAGRAGDAADLLIRFKLERRWEMAAQLVAAWLAAGKDPTAAKALRERARVGYMVYPLPVLDTRVGEALGEGKFEPPYQPLPPDAQGVQDILKRMGGFSTGEGLEGLHGEGFMDTELWSAIDVTLGNVPIYVAENDAPQIIAYAAKQPEEGLDAFITYARLHAANRYTQYRSIQLWILLAAALRHPDAGWALKAAREVIALALVPTEHLAFEEALPLALVGAQAASGDRPEQAELLEKLLTRVLNDVDQLNNDERGNGDMMGEHKRRLSALALAFAMQVEFGMGADPRALQLLRRAAKLPYGYAGLMTPAWINLAETGFLCGLPEPEWKDALQQAQTTAYKIKDVLFCARSVAAVNSVRAMWEDVKTGPELEQLVNAFANKQGQARFSPLHRVGENYGTNPGDLPANPQLAMFTRAVNLTQIAETFGLQSADLLAYNLDKGWQIDTPLAQGELVALPDATLAPTMAASLSAWVAGSDLLDLKKQELIQKLVPIAMPDRTQVDIVLSRLVFTVRPEAEVVDKVKDQVAVPF